jgi:hypothetical protein
MPSSSSAALVSFTAIRGRVVCAAGGPLPRALQTIAAGATVHWKAWLYEGAAHAGETHEDFKEDQGRGAFAKLESKATYQAALAHVLALLNVPTFALLAFDV